MRFRSNPSGVRGSIAAMVTPFDGNLSSLPAGLRWIPEVHRLHRSEWLCHEATSEPPFLPTGIGATGKRLAAVETILTSADGTRLRGQMARAAGDGGDAVVIAPDVRGLHPFYAKLADRFAEAGVHAIAFDYFGRTLGTASPPLSFYVGGPQAEPFREHITATKPDSLQEDVHAAISYLRQVASARRVFIVGFCFGGRLALNAAAEQPDLTGAISFYGFPVPRTVDDRDAPLQKVDRLRAPILALFAGSDHGIPLDAVDTFANALAARPLPHQIVTYPGVPHAFFDRRFEQNQAACGDAWRRLLAFIRTGDPAAR